MQDNVRLMTLDPGHFHAALVQKRMYEQVSPVVSVFAPEGPDLDLHLQRVEAFNQRADQPTNWQQQVHAGPDYLDAMLQQRPGNAVVVAGNSSRRPGYLQASVQAGLHVLADKPICIDPPGWEVLAAACQEAQRKGLLVCDIMTQRHEITTSTHALPAFDIASAVVVMWYFVSRFGISHSGSAPRSRQSR